MSLYGRCRGFGFRCPCPLAGRLFRRGCWFAGYRFLACRLRTFSWLCCFPGSLRRIFLPGCKICRSAPTHVTSPAAASATLALLILARLGKFLVAGCRPFIIVFGFGFHKLFWITPVEGIRPLIGWKEICLGFTAGCLVARRSRLRLPIGARPLAAATLTAAAFASWLLGLGIRGKNIKGIACGTGAVLRGALGV